MGGEYGGVNTGRLLMSFLSTSTYFKFEIKKNYFKFSFVDGLLNSLRSSMFATCFDLVRRFYWIIYVRNMF